MEEVNNSLRAAVQDLSTENDELRESRAVNYDYLDELAARLNKVTAFLLAVSSMQKRIRDEQRHGSSSSSTSTGGRLSFSDREDILSQELSKLEGDLLVESKKNREDILHSAYRYGRDIQSGMYNIGEGIVNQRNEMNDISRALDNIQRE